MEDKLKKEILIHLSERGIPRALSVWPCPFPRLDLCRLKMDACTMCKFMEKVRVEPSSSENGDDSLVVRVNLRKLTPAVVGMLRKKFFEYGKGGDNCELTKDFSAIVRRRRVIRNSGIISSDESEKEMQANSLCHRLNEYSGDSLSLRRSRGNCKRVTGVVRQSPTARPRDHSASEDAERHSSTLQLSLPFDGHQPETICTREMAVVKRGRRKRRRKMIEVGLGTSSEEDLEGRSTYRSTEQGLLDRHGDCSQSTTTRLVQNNKGTAIFTSVSPQAVDGTSQTNDRLSSTEDSGYPQSVCGSERVQELRSPSSALMTEDIFSANTSPMEFLSSCLTRGDLDERGRSMADQYLMSKSGSQVSEEMGQLEVPCGGGEVIPHDLDVLLSTNMDPEGMFEPGDLVMYNNEGRSVAEECLDFGMGSALDAVDLLDKLNEEGVRVDENFLEFDVQSLCKSMFPLDVSRPDCEPAGMMPFERVAAISDGGNGAPDKGEKSSPLPKSSKKKKRRLEEGGKTSSAKDARSVLPGRTSKSRFGRKIVPSWKIRSQDFNYDDEEEMEYIKMVYAQSRKECENQKWEEIERTLLQDWKKFSCGENYLQEVGSCLSSLDDLGVDWQMHFDDQTFSEFINMPLHPLMSDTTVQNSSDSLMEEDVDVTTVHPQSDAGAEEGGGGGGGGGEAGKGEGPCWVGKIRVDENKSEEDEGGDGRHKIVVIVRRKKKRNEGGGKNCEPVESQRAGGRSKSRSRTNKVFLKKPRVHIVRLKEVPRRSDHFSLQKTSSEDVPRRSGMENVSQGSAEVGEQVSQTDHSLCVFDHPAPEPSLSLPSQSKELGQVELHEQESSSSLQVDDSEDLDVLVDVLAADSCLVPFTISDLPLVSVRETPPLTCSSASQSSCSILPLPSQTDNVAPLRVDDCSTGLLDCSSMSVDPIHRELLADMLTAVDSTPTSNSAVTITSSASLIICSNSVPLVNSAPLICSASVTGSSTCVVSPTPLANFPCRTSSPPFSSSISHSNSTPLISSGVSNPVNSITTLNSTSLTTWGGTNSALISSTIFSSCSSSIATTISVAISNVIPSPSASSSSASVTCFSNSAPATSCNNSTSLICSSSSSSTPTSYGNSTGVTSSSSAPITSSSSTPTSYGISTGVTSSSSIPITSSSPTPITSGSSTPITSSVCSSKPAEQTKKVKKVKSSGKVKKKIVVKTPKKVKHVRVKNSGSLKDKRTRKTVKTKIELLVSRPQKSCNAKLLESRSCDAELSESMFQKPITGWTACKPVLTLSNSQRSVSPCGEVTILSCDSEQIVMSPILSPSVVPPKLSTPIFPPCSDEDYIDVHVAEEDMFSDVEGSPLDNIVVRKLPMSPAAVAVSAAPEVMQKDKQKEFSRPSRLSLKERLGYGGGRGRDRPCVQQGLVTRPLATSSASSPSASGSPSLSNSLPSSNSNYLVPSNSLPPPISAAACSNRPPFNAVHPSSSFMSSSNYLPPSNFMSSSNSAPPSNSVPSSNFMPPSNSSSFNCPPPPVSGGLQVPANPVRQPISLSGVDEVAPQNNRFCFNYMMTNYCSFGNRCKYQHVGMVAAPINALEYFLRVRPIGQIPLEVVSRYALDPHSGDLLQRNFTSFMTLILSLINADVVGVANNWSNLTGSIGANFNVPLLCRVLSIFARSAAYLSNAKALFVQLLNDRYQLNREDYIRLVEILGQYRLIDELKRLHAFMDSKGVHPDLPILTEMTKYKEGLGEWVFCLLQDMSRCAGSDQEGSFKLAAHLLNAVGDGAFATKTSLQAVSKYLEACPLFAQRINIQLFRKMSQALMACQLWTPLLVFLEQSLHLWASLPRTAVCKPLEMAIEQVGVSDRVMKIVEHLTKIHKASLSCQAWEKIILWCAQSNRTQTASSYYRMASGFSKKLSSEGAVLLAQLFQDQHSPGMAMAVLRDGLQRIPPVLPPLPLLTDVATSVGVVNRTQDIFPVATVLIQRNISPPFKLLEVLLQFISKEKCYSKLSELVRSSMKCDVNMGGAFYERAAAELDQWGQDPDAVRLATMAAKRDGSAKEAEEKKKQEEDKAVKVLDEKAKNLRVSKEEEGRSKEERHGNVDCQVTDMDIDNSFEVCPEGTTQSELPATPLQSWMESDRESSGPSEQLAPVATVGEVSSASVPEGVREPPSQRAPHFLLDQSPPSTFGSPGMTTGHQQGLERGVAPQQNSRALCSTPPELLQLIQTNGRMGQYRAVASILVDLESTGSWYDDSLVLSIWEVVTTTGAFSSFLSHLDQSRSNLTSVSKGKSGPGSSLLSSDRWLASQLGIALIRLCLQKKDWHNGYAVLRTLHTFDIPYVTLSQPSSKLPLLVFSPPTPFTVAFMAANLCLHIINRGTSSAMEVLRGSSWAKASNAEEAMQRVELIISVARQGLSAGMLMEVQECLEKVSDDSLPEKFAPEVTDLYNKLLLAVLEQGDTGLAITVYSSIKKGNFQCRPGTFTLLLKAICDTNQHSTAQDLCQKAIADNCYAPLYNSSPYEVTFPPGLTQLETRLLLEEHMKKLSMNAEGGKRNLVMHLTAGSRKLMEVAIANLNPPLKLSSDSKDVVISGDSLVLWRSANPCSMKPTVPIIRTMPAKAKPKTTKVYINRKVRVANAYVLIKLQEDAVRREFGSAMKPYRSRFNGETDYKHLIRLLSASYFKTSQAFRGARQAAVSLEVGENWDVPSAIKEEVGQIVANIVSKFSMYSMDMDNDLGLC